MERDVEQERFERPEQAARPTSAPPESPGPSVSPAGTDATDQERFERAEETKPQPDDVSGRGADTLAEREASAAAAEAGSIGGQAPPDGGGDPAMDPVHQAGGGVAEGFEAAEEQLIEEASHGSDRAKPLSDALTPEAESDASGAVYGEPDEVDPTGVVRDPSPGTDLGPADKSPGDDDPGAGPNIAPER